MFYAKRIHYSLSFILQCTCTHAQTLGQFCQFMGSAHITFEVQKQCSLYAGVVVPFLLQALVPSASQESADASARDKSKARYTTEDGYPLKSRKERAYN